MPPHALIINPAVHDFKLYDEWMHPLGLYFLLSYLKHNQWDTTYINTLERDTNKRTRRYSTGEFRYEFIEKPGIYESIPRKYKRYGIPPAELKERLKCIPRPDVILFGSSMTYWINGFIETVQNVKQVFPDSTLFTGGLSAELIGEFITLKLPEMNIVKGGVKGLGNEIGRIRPDLQPKPTDKGWIPTFTPALQETGRLMHAPLLTGTGCPFSCSYCVSSFINPVFRKRDKSLVMDEFQEFLNMGIRDFTFYDDALLVDPEAVFIPIIEKAAESDQDISFHTPNGLHIRYIDRKILRLMKEAGFKTLRFGYETDSPDQNSGKAGLHDLNKLSEMLRSSGFSRNECGVYIMAGIPGISPEDVKTEIDYAVSLGLRIKPVFLSPVPGTEVFRSFSEEYPILRNNPLSHNDLFFSTLLSDWDYETIDWIKNYARDRNRDY